MGSALPPSRRGYRTARSRSGRGPIVDQSGKDQLKAVDVADDKFLHGITFHVKGVEGNRRCIGATFPRNGTRTLAFKPHPPSRGYALV
jgi:hypothetical protein